MEWIKKHQPKSGRSTEGEARTGDDAKRERGGDTSDAILYESGELKLVFAELIGEEIGVLKEVFRSRVKGEMAKAGGDASGKRPRVFLGARPCVCVYVCMCVCVCVCVCNSVYGLCFEWL
jgi:hypothetical protein